MKDSNKKSLSEQDICSKYVLPSIVKAGWDLHKQIREQLTFTAGRIIVERQTFDKGREKARRFYSLLYK